MNDTRLEWERHGQLESRQLVDRRLPDPVGMTASVSRPARTAVTASACPGRGCSYRRQARASSATSVRCSVHDVAHARPKVLEYDVEVDRAGRMTTPGGAQIAPAEGWSPDHYLVAALILCSIKALTYHAQRAGHQVSAGGSGHATVAMREDGRFALRDVAVGIQAQLTPRVADTGLLTAKAERDCFVGASLTVKPAYTWQVT
jgi:organic hydroperoxide reductase OsmC/OhrA